MLLNPEEKHFEGENSWSNFRVKVAKEHILLYIGQLCINVDMSEYGQNEMIIKVQLRSELQKPKRKV